MTKVEASQQRFANQIVIVTGGTRGIGKNIARSFGTEGARVMLVGNNEAEGKSAETELCAQGIRAEFLPVDLSKQGTPQEMIREVVRRWGGLDILVNNARSGQRLGMLEETEETWEQGMAVTLRAAFFASQEAIRVMAERGGGNIVNISSITALMTSHESPVYHIAKAGMAHMTRYLATYAGVYGIRVNAVLPGFIIKDEHRERYHAENNEEYRRVAEFIHPLSQVGVSGDVADVVLFLCSKAALFITGQCLVVDGGSTAREQSSLLYQFLRTDPKLEDTRTPPQRERERKS